MAESAVGFCHACVTVCLRVLLWRGFFASFGRISWVFRLEVLENLGKGLVSVVYFFISSFWRSWEYAGFGQLRLRRNG